MVDDTTLETVRTGIDRARTRFVSNARIGIIGDTPNQYELVSGDTDRQVITVTLDDGDIVRANRGTTPPVAGEPVTVNKRNGQYYIEGVATLPTRSDAPRALATVDAHSHNKGYLWFTPVDAGSLLDGGMDIVAGTTTITLKRKLYYDDSGDIQVYAGGDTLDLDNYRSGISGGEQRWAIVYVTRSTGTIGVYEPAPVSAPANTTTHLSTAITACLDSVSGAYPYLAMRVNAGSINLTKYKPANGYDLSGKDFIRFDISPTTIESLGSLTDVDLTSVADGALLKYNAGTQEWVDGNLQIDELGDVNTTSPFNSAHYLGYDAGVWVNRFIRLDELGNVRTDDVTTGNILIASGGAFESHPLSVDDVQTGTLNHEYGGLEADVSNYGGIALISGGSTSEIKYNLTATTDPSATDDSGSGYAVGSLWVNTTRGRTWQCVDSATSAAVWQLIGGVYGFRANLTSNQSIANTTTTTLVFDNTASDPDSLYNTSTGQFTVPRDGSWAISTNVLWAFNSSGLRFIGIRINGGGYSARVRQNAAGQTEQNATDLTAILSSGDTVTIDVFQSSGGSINCLGDVATFFNARFVGDA